ncbi:hypothetical protein ABPG72_019185 [Tetrahymena utriculariae]
MSNPKQDLEISEDQDITKKFKRVNENDQDDGRDHQKKLHDNINSIFDEDREKFIGEFTCKDYTIIRGYINGNGKQLRLYYTKLEPFAVKKATVCIIHGFGEHSGRFLHIADQLAKAGCVVQLMDLRGFGYSGGPRGASTIEELHQDIQVLLKQANKDLPLYLYGHSMGGLLVITLAMRNPVLNIAGVITTSALIGFPKDRKMNFFKAYLVKALGKKLEDIVINSMIHPTALTKNNEYIKKCFGDRLMIPFLGMNMAKSILEGTEYVLPNAFKFSFPCLVIHGQKDMVTNHYDSIAFYNKCSSKDKTLKLFENGYHEMQHDEECDELIETVKDWILKRADRAKPLGLITKLKCGLESKKQGSKIKKFIIFLIIVVYCYYLFKFRNHPLFQKSFKYWIISPLINLYIQYKMLG